MPFDLGFNFRSTAGYVTDPAYGVPVLGEEYPHTYTTGNGDSVNAGWTSSGANKLDRADTNDPRIAGINFTNGPDFQIDLASGSGPGARDYLVDLAAGDAGGTQTLGFDVKDTAVTLITIPGQSVTGGHYLDATVTDRTATTTWAGEQVSQTFATTTCLLAQNGSNIFIAHFRLRVPPIIPHLRTAITARGAIGERSMKRARPGYEPTLTGTEDFSDLDTTAPAVFPVGYPSATYTVAFGDVQVLVGSPDPVTPSATSKTADGFTVTLDQAPGVGTSVRVPYTVTP